MPVLVIAATREECTQMLKRFAPLEKAYDAVVQSKVASPVSEQVIAAFRRDGEIIYTECKDKMSTTPWYMLGKKIRADAVNIANFHMQSVKELRQYAITHPPVITNYVCGSVIPGGPGAPGRKVQ